MSKWNAILAESSDPSAHEKNSHLPIGILLVDDEQEFILTLAERLQMRDMNTRAVFDGHTALENIRTDPPRLMIIDLKMPKMDGIQLLNQIKQTHPGIQVIVLTGHGSHQDQKKCMDSGALAYFQKPVDIELLCRAIQQGFRKPRSDTTRDISAPHRDLGPEFA